MQFVAEHVMGTAVAKCDLNLIARLPVFERHR
jgi:hypothetical protein